MHIFYINFVGMVSGVLTLIYPCILRLGAVVHACNPSSLGGQGGRMTAGQEFEISLGNIWRPHRYKKLKKKISRVWGHILVVPAAWEAEAETGGSLELRSWRLQ